MRYANAVLEAVVRRARKNLVGEPELLQPSQALKVWRVHEGDGCWAKLEMLVDWIVEDLGCLASAELGVSILLAKWKGKLLFLQAVHDARADIRPIGLCSTRKDQAMRSFSTVALKDAFPLKVVAAALANTVTQALCFV